MRRIGPANPERRETVIAGQSLSGRVLLREAFDTPEGNGSLIDLNGSTPLELDVVVGRDVTP